MKRFLFAAVFAVALLSLPACSTSSGDAPAVSTATVESVTQSATSLAIKTLNLSGGQIDYVFTIASALRTLMDGRVPTPSEVLDAIHVELGSGATSALDGVAVAVAAVYQSYYDKFSDSTALEYLEAVASGVETAAKAARD